jgi:hypothetical protein
VNAIAMPNKGLSHLISTLSSAVRLFTCPKR